MRLKGKKITPPKPQLIILPRTKDDGTDDDSLVFMAGAVLDFSDFDRLCPAPIPAKKTFPGGKVIDDLESPDFIKRTEEHFGLRYTWLILKSLEATEGLEWETVDYQKSETWNNYQTELEKVLTKAEIGQIQLGVMNANSMNHERQMQARERFLHTPVPVV